MRIQTTNDTSRTIKESVAGGLGKTKTVVQEHGERKGEKDMMFIIYGFRLSVKSFCRSPGCSYGSKNGEPHRVRTHYPKRTFLLPLA